MALVNYYLTDSEGDSDDEEDTHVRFSVTALIKKKRGETHDIFDSTDPVARLTSHFFAIWRPSVALFTPSGHQSAAVPRLSVLERAQMRSDPISCVLIH